MADKTTCTFPLCKLNAVREGFCIHHAKHFASPKAKKEAKPLKKTPIKKSKTNDAELWKVFSEYIRRRDADTNGIGSCFTCGLLRHWKKADCGHGIPRQHWGTRYNEQNNHFQCKKCNGFEGGKQDVYKDKVNKKYGAGTWERLELLSRIKSKRPGEFEISVMVDLYKKKIEVLKKEKGEQI